MPNWCISLLAEVVNPASFLYLDFLPADTKALNFFLYGRNDDLYLTAVDTRIKAAVAAVTPILKEPHSAMAVHNFASFITNQPFLMLMGNTDERNYTKVEAQQLHDMIMSE